MINLILDELKPPTTYMKLETFIFFHNNYVM